MKFHLFPRLLGIGGLHAKPKKRPAPWESMFDDILPLCFLDFSLRQAAETQNIMDGR